MSQQDGGLNWRESKLASISKHCLHILEVMSKVQPCMIAAVQKLQKHIMWKDT